MDTQKTNNKKQNLPKNFETAFKPADIRGIYPDELNEELTYRIARAFVYNYRLERVLLGRDMRLSSPALRNAFVKGATDQGAGVIDLGMIDTPAVYFASGKFDLYGAMITASHNPKEFNGIKLVRKDAIPLTEESGLYKIKALIIKNEFPDQKRKGTVEKREIFSEYQKYLHSLVKIRPKRKIKIVVDAGNGMGTVLTPIICKGFPIEMYPLFFKLDGTFPNRGSNPTLEKNMKPIQEEIDKVKPDFGVAFDGDVDRVAFFDEKGRAINSAIIGALIAKNILQKKKGKIVYTMYTSKSYLETIKKYGGTPIRVRIGHSFIKEAMREHDAIFGCEHSAHFYFKGNFYTDSGILTLLKILEIFTNIISEEEKKFSEIVKEFDKYYQTEEVLIKVKDKKKILKSVEDIYKEKKPKKLNLFDGLYVEFSDYWFDLKKSVTEDALKLMVEAIDKNTMQKRQKELLTLVEKLNVD